MTAFWVSIVIGLLIVLAAIGIPLWMTHRRMHEHNDLSEGEAYLEAAGRTPEDAAAGRADRRAGEKVVKVPQAPAGGPNRAD